MLGPMAPSFWEAARRAVNGAFSFQHLDAGQRYVVTMPFLDHDGDAHPPGERWLFLGSSFQPRDDGLSLFVSLDGVNEWQIRLQWGAEEQGTVIDRLADHMSAVPD